MANTNAFKIKNGLDLGAYNKDISDTAVDVFVYDTSKDSDGGAWRKRTQGTSWYNEAASATRGSRKEFPAVAVIVAESTQLTIYDGDDPDLPMWMVFNQTVASPAYEQFWRGTRPATGVFSLNGMLTFSVNSSSVAGVQVSNFASDELRRYSDNSTYSVIYSLPVSGRNSTSNPVKSVLPFIINPATNDVAMTVLPNAPIDAATGLPVPTIGIATAGGTSVIRDDGTVVDITTSNSSYTSTHSVKFQDGGVYNQFGQAGNAAFSYYYIFNTIPTADTQISLNTLTATGQDPDAFGTANSSISVRTFDLIGEGPNVLREIEPNAAGGDKGITLLSGNLGVRAKNEVAFVTSDYNTGWMNGDIKLATLSDTDDTNVTGSDVAPSSYNAVNSYVATFTSGVLSLTPSGHSDYGANATVTGLTSGDLYVLSYDVTTAVDGSHGLQTTDANGTVDDRDVGGVGSYNRTLVVDNDGELYIMFGRGEIGGTSGSVTNVFENIVLRLAEEDRSVNGNGLQVFGSITKDPVASGADLVGYSAGSNGDGLVQPHNTDLEFGTGDFCFMFWGKQVASPTVNGKFVSLSDTNATGTTWVGSNINIDVNNVGLVKAFITDDAYASNDQIELNADGNDNTWYCYALVRRGNTFYGYKNGELNESVAVSNASGSLTSTDSRIHVLIDPRRAAGNTGYGSQTDVDIALLRISATAPSPKQIAKIYEDEKFLFQDGAQATLYGTSDAVTALAYDDSTELLHVGTSAGRSVFQGLRRVDNTTTAVSAAISASNNLVGEQ